MTRGRSRLLNHRKIRFRQTTAGEKSPTFRLGASASKCRLLMSSVLYNYSTGEAANRNFARALTALQFHATARPGTEKIAFIDGSRQSQSSGRSPDGWDAGLDSLVARWPGPQISPTIREPPGKTADRLRHTPCSRWPALRNSISTSNCKLTVESGQRLRVVGARRQSSIAAVRAAIAAKPKEEGSGIASGDAAPLVAPEPTRADFPKLFFQTK